MVLQELQQGERVVGGGGAGGDDDGSFPVAAVAGAGAAALALFLLAALLCVFRKRVFGACARRGAPAGGAKEPYVTAEAVPAPESPGAREARRTQKRALYDKLHASAREKRQPSFVVMHPAALAPGAVESVATSNSQSGSGGDPDIRTLTVGTATGTSPRGSDSAARLARGDASGELATAPALAMQSPFATPPPAPRGDQSVAQLLWAQQQAAAAASCSPPLLAANSFLHGTPSMLHSGMGSAMGASLFPSAMSNFHAGGGGGTVMAPRGVAKDKLSRALEAMATAYPPVPFAGEYVLSTERITGRQAVIVFAADNTRTQYAIKCASPAARALP